jgi:hypothetical protein
VLLAKFGEAAVRFLAVKQLAKRPPRTTHAGLEKMGEVFSQDQEMLIS